MGGLFLTSFAGGVTRPMTLSSFIGFEFWSKSKIAFLASYIILSICEPFWVSSEKKF
jgi:hypothetical protein